MNAHTNAAEISPAEYRKNYRAGFRTGSRGSALLERADADGRTSLPGWMAGYEDAAAGRPADSTPPAPKFAAAVQEIPAEQPAPVPAVQAGEPHAFSAKGSAKASACVSCDRTWAASAHRKFRAAASA